MSVSNHPLRRDVACAVTAGASESEGAVVELVQQSRLCLMVDLQTAREGVEVQHCVGACTSAGRVLPDTEHNPEPVPVVINGQVRLASDETPWNDSSVMAILLPTRAVAVEPKTGL